MLLACGEQGLWRWECGWQRAACPLTTPTLLGAGLVADVQARLAWDGRRMLSLPPGTECLLRCPWGHLVLSGEADSLSLIDATGQLAVTAPAGMYPQGMCLLPKEKILAVCGGAEGLLRLMSLPGLHLLRSIHLPGSVQQAACAGEMLCVLSLVEEEGLRCRVSRVSLPDGCCEALLTLPGLSGSVCADGSGGWWVAASERLCHLDGRGRCVACREGWGLITHMERSGARLLLTDSVLGLCAVMDVSGEGKVQILFRGDVHQACFLEKWQENRLFPAKTP